MFAVHNIDDLEIRDLIANAFPDAAENGNLSSDFAIVSSEFASAPTTVGMVLRKGMEGKLLDLAREAAERGECCAQDSRIKCGIRFAGDDSIEATIMHAGEKVVVVVGALLYDASFAEVAPDSILPAIIAESGWIARLAYVDHMIDHDWSTIRAFKRRNRRKAVAPNGRTVFAWRVPGTPEHGTLSLLEASHRHRTDGRARTSEMLASARARVRAAIRNIGRTPCEGCMREVPEADLTVCGNPEDGYSAWCPACMPKGGAACA
jgi:hypothetical protein